MIEIKVNHSIIVDHNYTKCDEKDKYTITNFILMKDIKDVKCDAEYEFIKGENYSI